MSNELFDFIDGQSDCRSGVEHKSGRSEAYDRGYAAEYESEQVMAVQAERGCRFLRAHA
jgi:hypothetical protein